MNSKKNVILKDLAAAGLEKCLLKLTRASSGTWEAGPARVFTGDLRAALERVGRDRPAAAVHVDVADKPPFTTALLFNSGDTGHIGSCFVKDPLPAAAATERFEEVMLIEIGNIILNALINSLLNALNRSAVPSVPMYIAGGADAIAAGLGAVLGSAVNFRVVTAALTIRRDGREGLMEAVVLLPEELAAELE